MRHAADDGVGCRHRRLQSVIAPLCRPNSGSDRSWADRLLARNTSGKVVTSWLSLWHGKCYRTIVIMTRILLLIGAKIFLLALGCAQTDSLQEPTTVRAKKQDVSHTLDGDNENAICV